MDSRMLLTYIIVDIFCIIIVGIINQNIITDSGSELEVKMIKRSLLTYIVFMVTSITSLITENTALFYSQGINYASNMISLTCLAFTSFY